MLAFVGPRHGGVVCVLVQTVSEVTKALGPGAEVTGGFWLG